MTPRRNAFNAAWDEGKSHRDAGRLSNALDAYDRALARLDEVDAARATTEPMTTQACALWSDIAAARCGLGDLMGALAAVDHAIELPVDYQPTSHYDRGVIVAKLGRHDEALSSFDFAIASVKRLYRLPPKSAGDYFFARGECLEALGRLEAAVDSYECALPLGNGRSMHAAAKARLQALGRKIPKLAAPRWAAGG